MSPIARHVARSARRGALIWGCVYAFFVWVSTYGYALSYPKLADRVAFAESLGNNTGIRAIFGPAHNIDTVQGFTGWRCASTFALIGIAWGLLLATKTLRGDEEAGRAEMLYAGPVTRRSGLVHLLLGLGLVWATLFAVVFAGVVAVGVIGRYYAFGAGVFFSVVACGGAAMGMGVGALSSQLTVTRRAASTIGGAVFGVAFLLRAIGESVDSLRWALWASPVGWLDKTRPLTGSRVTPLLLVVGLVVGCGVAAVHLARRRDLGGAVFASRDTAEPRLSLLGSPLGLSARLALPTAIAWSIGAGMVAAVFGTVSSAITDGLGDNQGVSDIFARMGADVSAKGYVGLTFVMLGALVSVAAASFVGAARAEEAEGRLEYLAAAPVDRGRWLAGRVLSASIAIACVGVAAGLGGWLGVRASGGNIAFTDMLAAGLNIAAPGIVTLGIGTLVHGVAARFATQAAYAVVVWSFLVELLGSAVEVPRLVADTSLIHHLSAAPLVAVDWGTNATMLVVGLFAATVGSFALRRRDLQMA